VVPLSAAWRDLAAACSTNILVAGGYARGLTNLFDLYIPIVNTTCVYDGASFPPIPIAEIDGERELVLDYNHWERIQLHRKKASHD
jgi:hypothetical protein